MDFKTLDLTGAAERGAVMTVRHPISDEDLVDGKGNPITITLLGNDSREFRRKMDEISRNRQGKKKTISLAEGERMASELLASVTKSWSGIEWDGKPLECNYENALMLYRERAWLRVQVDEFVADAGNFFKKPAIS